MNQPAIVQLHVVGHDILPAVLGTVYSRAALGGERHDRWNEMRHLARLKRIAYVPHPHAGVEVGDEYELAVVGRVERLAARVRAEAGAAGAEIGAPGRVAHYQCGNGPQLVL